VKLTAEHAPRRRVDFIYVMLSEDHVRMDALFASLVATARSDDRAMLPKQWERFERELSSHMELEEAEILPAFAREHAEEARSIRDEHATIRAGLAEMGIDLDLHCLRADRVEAFTELLRAHAKREEALLYPWASRVGP
jgi:hemerythrin-like domain-containing protein